MTSDKQNTFNSVFEIDEEYENSSWLKVKIRTFSFGENRNGSNILDSSFSGFTKAKSSVGAVPIVAKYNRESDNLEGHNVSLRKNSVDEYEIFHDTDALGFTSPTAEFYLEEVNEGTEEEPDNKTYVVIEDVYLWKRFDATKRIIEWFEEGTIPTVSMEIDEVEGQFDSDGYFQIQDFTFIGIAALGTDIEPCFKKAEIQMYTANDFKSELKALMTELNEYSLKEGGNKMPAKETKDVQDEIAKHVEGAKADETEVVETKTDTDAVATEDDANKDTEVTGDSSEAVEDVNKEELEEDLGASEDEVDYKAEFEALKTIHQTLESDVEAIKSELSTLQSYKRKRQEDDLKEKFEGKLSNDELEQLFTSSKDLELEKIEEKVYALIGKKNFSIQKPSEKNENKIFVPVQKEENDSPYGSIFD